MALTGKLRSWNDERGFGFIAPRDGGRELFVHISALERASPPIRALNEGQKVSFDLENDPRKGKVSAGNLKLA